MYVDAFHDRKADVIRVAERIDGKRVLVDHKPDYTFYVADPRGKHRSIYGEPVASMKATNKTEFRKLVAQHSHCKKFESDIKPLNKILEKHYLGATTPKLHTAFFDIEVDFDPERGYATPEEAFMPITSIGVYLQWMDTMLCFAVPPKTLSWEQAQSIADRVGNVVLCRTEKEMLNNFLDVIDDADILSGWNSEGYDIPYTINRIIKSMGRQETRRMCLWDQLPELKEYEKFGKEQKSYTLTGRVHLDYLELYRKYNYEERHSYKLDFIGEMEVGEKKVEYEGSLDRLYNHDFEKFLEYNIQDTMLLHKLDRKLQFIDLANTIAHDNTVLLPTIMGAVATTEQGIINEAHRRGFVCPDKVHSEKDSKAAGAYVAFPVKGYHEWIGSSDLNSLYPSVFRALNMGAETIVGQIRLEYTDREIREKMEGTWINPETGKQIPKKMDFAGAWSGKFASNEYELMMKKDSSVPLKLDMEDGTTIDVTGSDVYNLIFHSGEPWNISANGTIFKTDFQGIVPGLLERWYAERKQMQAKMREYDEKSEEYSFWDKRQLVKKINLNSLYGAILNPHCRFFDKRIGQSTTLTGRCIAKHMAAKTNELLAGVYDHSGDTIIYGDTDSVYFSAVPVLPEGTELDLESAVKLYDHVSDTVSDTFPGFLKEAFNVPLEAGKVMKAGREVVGRAGLFITKKRYAIKCLDIEGWQPEGGKLKIMGMDVKRSDTPEFVQDFLEDILDDALSGHTEADVIAKIREFKKFFQDLEPWKKGMPKRVNNLTPYTKKYEKIKGRDDRDPLNPQQNKKPEPRDGKKENNMIPGHVTASIHWNYLKKMHGDQYSMNITDGMKVIVCRLKNNSLGYTNVAYPTDEMHLPDWFKELPFDEEGMEQSVLNKKIENVLGAMGWDLARANQSAALDEFFEF
jgi:DNA polymerase elongation subunit (family B)